MAEYHLVESATWSPTRCIFCGAAEGPFVDTGVELDFFGHAWICARSERSSGCAQQIGRADGMVAAADVQDGMEALGAMISELQEQLDLARRNQVVPLHDVFALIGAERGEL
jgi:hypothetical protein